MTTSLSTTANLAVPVAIVIPDPFKLLNEKTQEFQERGPVGTLVLQGRSIGGQRVPTGKCFNALEGGWGGLQSDVVDHGQVHGRHV